MYTSGPIRREYLFDRERWGLRLASYSTFFETVITPQSEYYHYRCKTIHDSGIANERLGTRQVCFKKFEVYITQVVMTIKTT